MAAIFRSVVAIRTRACWRDANSATARSLQPEILHLRKESYERRSADRTKSAAPTPGERAIACSQPRICSSTVTTVVTISASAEPAIAVPEPFAFRATRVLQQRDVIRVENDHGRNCRRSSFAPSSAAWMISFAIGSPANAPTVFRQSSRPGLARHVGAHPIDDTLQSLDAFSREWTTTHADLPRSTGLNSS